MLAVLVTHSLSGGVGVIALSGTSGTLIPISARTSQAGLPAVVAGFQDALTSTVVRDPLDLDQLLAL